MPPSLQNNKLAAWQWQCSRPVTIAIACMLQNFLLHDFFPSNSFD